MPNGISHRYQLEQSISVSTDVGLYFSLLVKFLEKIMHANIGDPDQVTHFVASDLGLHYLHMSHKKNARHIWVKNAIILLIT